MYSIGEKVVYPLHGAGVIEAIEERTIMGVKKKYYIMEIDSGMGRMRLSLPVDSCEKAGLREVMSKDEAAKLLDFFKNFDPGDDINWNKRQRVNIQRIKSDNVYDTVRVLKELMFRDARRGLSTGERKLLNGTRRIIVSELVMSGLGDKEDIDEIMEDIIEAAVNE